MQSPSPVKVYRRTTLVDGDPADMLVIEWAETGEPVAQCFIGDDLGVERIADGLSARRLVREAQQVRSLVAEARRASRTGSAGGARPAPACPR